MQLLYIGAFGLAGVFLRYALASSFNPEAGSGFPWGTFLVNLLGALAVGAIYTLGVEKAAISPELRVGIIVGLLGGFTTFSAYCLESVQLLNEGRIAQALLYVLLSNVLGVGAAFAGVLLARNF